MVLITSWHLRLSWYPYSCKIACKWYTEKLMGTHMMVC